MRPSRSGVAAYRLVQQTLHRTEPVRAQSRESDKDYILVTHSSYLQRWDETIAAIGRKLGHDVCCINILLPVRVSDVALIAPAWI